MITGSTVTVTAQTMMTSIGTILGALALGYAAAAALAVRLRRNIPAAAGARLRAITVLKPLCGAEPELYHCLRSFCEQSYPGLQIVFGLQASDDPALAAVERLKAEFPELDLEVVIDPRRHGASAKVSNLINMMSAARHDWLVLSDSDVRVPPGYLLAVATPLADPEVGMVTCPYRGLPVARNRRSTLCSMLGALFINDWFIPVVRVGSLLGSGDFVSGVTIALRRNTLEAVGGFRAVADQLADDYRLGELTRSRQLRTVLSEVTVDTWVDEDSVAGLLQHELRWLRTIRAVRPAGYLGAIMTFSLPLAALGCILAGGTPVTLGLLAATAGLRLVLHFTSGREARAGRLWTALWVVPLGDLLALALWFWGFAAREVKWREARYRLAPDGSAYPISRGCHS